MLFKADILVYGIIKVEVKANSQEEAEKILKGDNRTANGVVILETPKADEFDPVNIVNIEEVK